MFPVAFKNTVVIALDLDPKVPGSILSLDNQIYGILYVDFTSYRSSTSVTIALNLGTEGAVFDSQTSRHWKFYIEIIKNVPAFYGTLNR